MQWEGCCWCRWKQTILEAIPALTQKVRAGMGEISHPKAGQEGTQLKYEFYILQNFAVNEDLLSPWKTQDW